MDPSKASAPPPGWNPDDKAGMAPPPYQDHPQYPYPGAYQPPAQGAYYPPGPAGTPTGQPYPQGQYPGQFPPGQYPQGATVMVQPTVYVTHTPLVNPAPDYLAYSIFTLICCCLPLGIAALVYSVSVSTIFLKKMYKTSKAQICCLVKPFCELLHCLSVFFALCYAS